MDITFAKKFLQQRANELGFIGTVRIRQSEYVGPVSFIAEFPDGSFTELGASVQDAENMIKRLTGVSNIKPVKRAAPTAARAKAKAVKNG